MGIINVLDFSVANLIAAGEVVDRPASVRKELLENSIDAGADDITVEIKRGGIAFMRVSDNGKGIDKDDLPVAIKRHATSKIKDASDLDSIFTLGFRGEALAAIASVSKLRIMSKTKLSQTGYLLQSECGALKSITEAGCPDGTTVIVENLFENVPARLKFLKKDSTEAMAVCAYVEKIALSRPDISIKLIIDGNLKFMTTGDSNLYNVIYILFGRDFAKRLINVDNNCEGVRVYGYTGAPDNIRANRNFQNFFINGRYIKSKTVTAALEQAYSTFIPSDKFPCAVLNIDINPSLVDVNVHPAKLEVKFSNEKMIFEAVYSTIRQALENKIERPEFKIRTDYNNYAVNDYTKNLNPFVPVKNGREECAQQLTLDIAAYKTDITQIQRSHEPPSYLPQSEKKSVDTSALNVEIAPDYYDDDEKAAEPRVVKEFIISEYYNITHEDIKKYNISAEIDKSFVNQNDAEDNTVVQYRIIGEAFYSYIFVETGDSVLIIDKHAAHERIIFEELKKNLRNAEVISQILLVPIDVVMTDTEAAAIAEFSDEIERTGFEFKVYGNTVSVTAVPSAIADESIVDMLVTIADRLSDGTGNVTVSRDIIYERALFQASCKAAVKIGHMHTQEHLKWICERVISLDIIKFCPHGRPVAFELTKHDFERQFKRV